MDRTCELCYWPVSKLTLHGGSWLCQACLEDAREWDALSPAEQRREQDMMDAYEAEG